MFIILPIEIWQLILDKSVIKSQLMLRCVNKELYNLKIYDLFNVP